MTFKKLFSTLFVLWLLLAAVKYAFFGYGNFEALWLKIAFGVLVFLFSEILTRRLGVLNFLEALLVCGFYSLSYLFLDFLVLKIFLNLPLYSQGMYWISYALLVLSIFFFHKKRHIEIRKQQAHHHH